MTCPALKYVTNFTATACQGKLYVIGSCAVKYNALTMQCYNPVIGKDALSTILSTVHSTSIMHAVQLVDVLASSF